MNASLATALTDRPDVGLLLEQAERRGLFVTRLGSNGWFGMHSLVRSVLLDELARRSPERLPEQHGRAARWFEETGEVSLALEHLLLAGRQRDALRLLALKHADLYDCGREATVLRVIAGIPMEVAAADIESMLEFAWCHLLVNRRRFLQLVEQATWWSHHSSIDGPLRPRLTMLRSIAATIDGQWLAERHARSPSDARVRRRVVARSARSLRMEHDHPRGGAVGVLGREP